MPAPAVVNASPLILLGKIDRLGLLRALGQDLIVPDVVAEELNASPKIGCDPAVAAEIKKRPIKNGRLAPAGKHA